jgi:ketopantoate reductase
VRFVVVGAGAIGGTVGARLVRDGHDVLFCDADAEHVAAMNDHGLVIEGPVEELTPYSLEPPYTFRIQVKDSTQAAVCTYFPSVIREGPTTISLTSDDYREAFRGFIGMALLVSSTASGV